MRLLEQLEDHLEEIEEKDNWAFNFIENIKIQKEQYPEKKLTGAQFKKLCEIHSRYCSNR